ncbi:MAG: SDR family NAD(P)-dependent oxidoreductase [Chitinivibrionales bacterium]|nr:SDR family NAD(P)-dependent oxidoreductase [Chitinivibrionales bacterium]
MVDRSNTVLITGGCGFIGTNLADALLASGKQVILYDNLSRPGVERNCEWLRSRYPGRVHVWLNDIRDSSSLRTAVSMAAQVYHFAAQVAVTTSLNDPLVDFEINLRGTLNLLEAARAQPRPPSIVFTSTNKVYGCLQQLALVKNGLRYEPQDDRIRLNGIGDDCPLDFHSPYGCSKGGADQYVLDYARSYGLPAVVLRMSCIYGPHQMGTEDQGWVAHFLIRARHGLPITLYGDGLQVRDVLYVEDLVRALREAQERSSELAGRAFTIGGGPESAISLRELVNLIGEISGDMPRVHMADWRTGDQRYFVADTSAFRKETGWMPRVTVKEGVQLLYDWLTQEHHTHAPLANVFA